MIEQEIRNTKGAPVMLIITGIPGSGKSYYANKLIKENKHSAVIVNRDNIRNMLGVYWVPSREKLVTEIELGSIKSALDNKYDVIIDATNLNPSTIKVFKDIAKYRNAEIIYENLIISPIRAYLRILWRTLLGGRYISYKVIKGFHNRYFKQ
jgi:predicted kinase